MGFFSGDIESVVSTCENPECIKKKIKKNVAGIHIIHYISLEHQL